MNKTIEILKENKYTILISAFAFLAGVPFGVLSYPLMEDKLPDLLGEVFGGVITSSTTETIMNVMYRNISASLIMMVFGLTIILALGSLFLNGYVVGLVGVFAVNQGIDVLKVLFAIIPHGVIELPAIFTATGLGLNVGVKAATSKGERIKKSAKAIREASTVYLTFVLPLLVVAAFIEVLISMSIVK